VTDARTLARFGLGGALLTEVMATWKRWELRRALFSAAHEHARREGRRLLVVLPPADSQVARVLTLYEYGSHHDDALRDAVRVHHVARGLPRVTSNSAVVYVACALEYVADLQSTMAELLRIAGSTDHLFVVTVQPWTFTAALHPAALWAGISDNHAVSMGPVTALHRGFAAGVILALAALSLTARSLPPTQKSLPPTQENR
jgi:hypothetical protein